MRNRLRPLAVGAACAALSLLVAGCQGGATNTSSNNSAGAAASNNSAAAAPAAPAPAQAALSPATGPLAIASDANLPEQCQTYVREAQSCLDTMPGAKDALKPHMLRTNVNRERQTWAREQTPELLTKACTRHLESLREEARTRYSCKLS